MKTSLRKASTPRRRTALRANERRLTALHPRRRFLSLAAGAAALPAVSRIARAQAYPTRPITMVVSFAAGGTADVVARVLAERMRTSMGQPIIVENIGGANGTIGVGRVARAAPDGYTLSMGSWTTHVVNGAIYPLQYDTFRDFAPISLISTQPYLVIAKKAMPANDLQGLIAWLKANPNKASSGTSGVGSPSHVSGILFQNITGTRFQFVPYRGGGPAIQDLVAGQFDFMFASAGDSGEQVRGRSIKAFAVMAENRLASAPNIPTVDEAGLPGFYHTVWSGLWAPRGTSKNVIDKLNTAVVEALADESVRARLASLGQEIYPRQHQTPEALGALQKAEIEKWWPIIKAAGIRAQ
jgi:tripartite-type tricarboxylate transporter receptor subunit TctC